MKKYKVAVLLSTYNPARQYLCEQVDSLLNQSYPVDLIIRDDGSTDRKHYCELEKYSQYENVYVIYGSNKGVFGSFMELLVYAKTKEYNFVGFSDQDDIALPYKVQRAVSMLSKYSDAVPLLYFSQMQYVDENLNKMGMPNINSSKLTLKNALFESSINGNLMFINRQALDIVTMCYPNTYSMHDWWVYVCVSAFGMVLYDDEVTLLYRQHNHNVVGGTSSFLKLSIMRIRRLINSETEIYPIYAQAKDFASQFDGKINMSSDTQKILDNLLRSKVNFIKRIKYAFSRDNFQRQKSVDNLLLRFMILLNFY